MLVITVSMVSISYPMQIIAVSLASMAVAIILYVTLSLRRVALVVWLLLVAKPLVDLTWKWQVGAVAGQRVNAQTVMAVFLVTLVAVNFGLRSRQLVRSPTVIAFLVSTSLSLFICATAPICHIAGAANEYLRFLSGVAIFFVAGSFLNVSSVFSKFTCVFLLVVTVPVILSFFQRLGFLEFEYWDWIGGVRVGRVSGTYQHPLNLAFYIVYAIPLALYLLSEPRGWIRHVSLLVFVALALLSLVLTLHRTALIASGVQILLWLFLRRKYTLLALGAVLITTLIVFQMGNVQLLYKDLATLMQGDFSPSLFRGRWANWQAFILSIRSGTPIQWLFGRGVSDASAFLPTDYVLSAHEPHNDFIRILHAYGLIGLCLYLLMLVSFTRAALQLRRAQDGYSRSLSNLMLVLLAGIATMSLTTEPMRYPSSVWYFFMLASIVTVRAHRVGRSSPSDHRRDG